MIKPSDMKVGDPVPCTEVVGWQTGDREHHCSACGKSSRYPSEEVMVVRHYKLNSTAGTWRWYCPAHFEHRKPWKNDHLAPPELRSLTADLKDPA